MKICAWAPAATKDNAHGAQGVRSMQAEHARRFGEARDLLLSESPALADCSASAAFCSVIDSS